VEYLDTESRTQKVQEKRRGTYASTVKRKPIHWMTRGIIVNFCLRSNGVYLDPFATAIICVYSLAGWYARKMRSERAPVSNSIILSQVSQDIFSKDTFSIIKEQRNWRKGRGALQVDTMDDIDPVPEDNSPIESCPVDPRH